MKRSAEQAQSKPLSPKADAARLGLHLAAVPVRALLQAHALVTLAVIATFARALPYPLHARWDDGRFILDNPSVLTPSWDAFVAITTEAQLEAYHPLHLLSYWLDAPWVWAATGGDAQALALTLHCTQLALFVLAANALLRVMLGLGLTLPFAVLATLACALHPIQVEVVSWATGRKDALALLFVCLAWLAHLRGRSNWSRALYVCAALSKTTALPLPLAMAIADVALARRSPRAALAHQAPALLIGGLLGVGVVTIWSDSAMLRSTEGSLAELPARLASTVGHQLSTALWPSQLSPLYPTSGLATPSASAWLLSVGFAAVCIVLARKGLRRELCGLLTFAVMLLPVSNALPMYFPLQDRYLSLPLVGLSFAVLSGLQRAGQHVATSQRGLAIGVGALCVLALALRTVQYQGVWQSELGLWEHAAQTQPRAFYAWMKLGELRRESGELGGAEQAYGRAVALEPGRKLGHAALLQARALRDERAMGTSGAGTVQGEPRASLAERYAAQYFGALQDADALRTLAGKMLTSGHLRALELPLARSLELAPPPDAALERAASVQRSHGRHGIARVYLRHMRSAPRDAELRGLWEREQREQRERSSARAAQAPFQAP